MNNFILGILIGSLLTGGLGWTGTRYDNSGKPAAPKGSIESYDYIRLRKQFLDVDRTARNTDALRRDATKPCAK